MHCFFLKAHSASYIGGGAEEAWQVAQVLIVTTPEFHTINRVAGNGNARTPRPRAEKDIGSPPYKAIIHVNLFGGMDSMNMLVPHPDGCQGKCSLTKSFPNNYLPVLHYIIKMYYRHK